LPEAVDGPLREAKLLGGLLGEGGWHCIEGGKRTNDTRTPLGFLPVTCRETDEVTCVNARRPIKRERRTQIVKMSHHRITSKIRG